MEPHKPCGKTTRKRCSEGNSLDTPRLLPLSVSVPGACIRSRGHRERDRRTDPLQVFVPQVLNAPMAASQPHTGALDPEPDVGSHFVVEALGGRRGAVLSHERPPTTVRRTLLELHFKDGPRRAWRRTAPTENLQPMRRPRLRGADEGASVPSYSYERRSGLGKARLGVRSTEKSLSRRAARSSRPPQLTCRSEYRNCRTRRGACTLIGGSR